MSDSQSPKNNEVPTLLVVDSKGDELLCFLEQIVPLSDVEYVLLTPVDTPVSLFRLREDNDPELIKTIEKKEPILEVADVVLQEYDLKLIRSAVTLTITGELDEPEPEELEEKDFDEDSELYELLVNFKVKDDEYGLYIPLDPFFIVGKIIDGNATVLEGEEFDKIQPLIEAELEKRDF
ncbi:MULTISPECIES: DUF3727 domain-containing protein [Prochlorococcus]|uniref:DUF3727 domain-containing protein n=1 Tax=Prochlorococcus marinus (strain SARG / CCMP1375 / SS120) TaxID=167539 RepID=Q7VC76_PROMA|nr:MULTISPECIES: DUF3727 domain-containing protein [Prochlorococcus]AAP99910.1 Uncharacterized protein Pro_0866 [Prochlorococcus marinus subsp. marinus str. CCMP1375]KGG11742.1 hypothetical protein EV04_0767 [Prochlorococcus marinus str. LG]KGG18844.1 hypothetical protein EV08_1330 [Prochlorococcus marinus str. SS2]KGG23618.1 hypothetical protein EV09_1243 [Prochlorococcus marinus str. SS35]KGG32146.1 hypothetical protein EV10_1260 [Prochlorococcus marinus str. SS51]